MTWNKNIKTTIKNIVFVAVLMLLGLTIIVFSVLYINTYDAGFVYKNINVISPVLVSIIIFITIFTLIFYMFNKQIVYKLFFTTLILLAIVAVGVYVLDVSGFLDKITSVEAFREYIDSFGGNAILLFVLIQILQVSVLPIPGFVTVGAGVLLFGAFKGALYSYIGIVIGSIAGYFIGRIFGYKAVKWMIGEENLKKGLKTIKGKDKVLLTFMFLFPFFPDDVMCFVAGITTITPVFFIIMILITRLISVFATSFSMNNSIIPYDTWWGIIIWVILFVAMIFLTIIIYKKGDKIEKRVFKRKHKENTK